MNKQVLRSGVYISATVLGILAGFFFVFNAVFSDVSSPSDRLFAVAVVSGVYLVLGFLFGRATFRPPMWWAVYVSGPALAMLAAYTFREPGGFLLHLFFAVVTFGAALAGAKASSNG